MQAIETKCSTPPPRVVCALLLLALCTACSSTPIGQRPDGPPNVLIILVDDLGYNDVGFNGVTEIDTPHIDRIAREGVVFSAGYAAHTSCAPSRAGIMTGRYPTRFGLERNLTYAPFDHLHGLPEEEQTLASRLQRAGYRTGMVGKWHLGAAPPFHPLNRGFDSFRGFLAGGHDYYTVDASGVTTSNAPSDEYLLPLDENGNPAGLSGYLTDVLTGYAVEFVEEGEGQPFFLYLSYNAPHVPLQAPDENLSKYAHVEDKDRRTYLAMVDSLDRNVGRIIGALEEAGEWDDTLTFFLSDNGGVADWADSGPLRGGKGSLYEGGIRVPFAASWPARWPRGMTFEPMVVSLDIAATAMALAGAAPDADRPLDGVNLDPFIRGAAPGAPHEALFWRRDIQRQPQKNTWAVRAGEMSLVKNARDGAAALFDLRADPGQTRDLIEDDAPAAARLTGLWDEWNAGNAPNFVVSEANYWLTIAETARRMHEDASEWGVSSPHPHPDGSLPDPPAGLTAEGGDRSITLRWNNPADPDITGYQFRVRAEDEDEWRPWRDFQGSGPSTPGRVLAGLTNGTPYRVQVRALSRAGEGGHSETTGTPSKDVDAQPMLPGAVADGDGRVRLTWSDPDDDAITGYQFRLKSLHDTRWRPWRGIRGSGAGTVNHQIGGLSAGVWYSVQLRALYPGGPNRRLVEDVEAAGG